VATSRHLLLALSASLAWLPLAAQTDTTVPVVLQAVPSQALGIGGSVTNLDLTPYFQDPEAMGTAVRITAQVGNLSNGTIDLALYDAETPQTVANFLAYVNGGYYAENIIHRSVAGFIIQGGEYYFSDYATDALAYVPTYPAVQNEPGISNVAGTIAMAKVSGNVNSATNQWFINMADNSENLDNQNGGFTVFGKVIGEGMTVANTINALPAYNATSVQGAPADWTDLPLTAPNLDNTSFVQTSMAVIPTLTYSVSSGNTSLVTASMSGNSVQLTPSATLTGSTNITITATALDAGQTQTTFTVFVDQTYSNWIAPYNFSPAAALATANPSGDGVPNLLKFAFGGNPLLAQRAPGLPQAESGGGVTFCQRQLAGLSYEVDESPDLVNWTKIWQTSDGLAAAPVAAHTTVSGYDVITVRDPSGGYQPLRFWRVQVSPTL
jgi:cyclophilin family peptidyl-prolyl cis-trans isomerase